MRLGFDNGTAVAADDSGISNDPGPCAEGRVVGARLSAAEQFDYRTAYEQACTQQDGGAYVRREGLNSSQVVE